MAQKKKAAKAVTPSQKKRIQAALGGLETKLIANYKKVAGKNWKKESTKYKKTVKKNVAQAKKRIEVEVRKNPAGATIAAAVLGAVAGAILMSKLKRKD